LPAPLVVPGVATMVTLADVRAMLKRLPAAFRDRPHWAMAAEHLEAAALGGDPEEAAMSLRFAFLVEGIACRPRAVMTIP
jgi:hypothetical protein